MSKVLLSFTNERDNSMEPKSSQKKVSGKRLAPKTAKGYEDDLVALAYERARERLQNGTAKSAEIVYFLQKGSPSERLKVERAEKEMQLMDAKIEAMKAQAKSELDYQEVLNAMFRYRGSAFDDAEEYEDED